VKKTWLQKNLLLIILLIFLFWLVALAKDITMMRYQKHLQPRKTVEQILFN